MNNKKPSAIRPADAAKGAAGETRFQQWLEASEVGFFNIEQNPPTMPKHLRGKFKRADYIVGILDTGQLAFEVEAKTIYPEGLIFDLAEVKVWIGAWFDPCKRRTMTPVSDLQLSHIVHELLDQVGSALSAEEGSVYRADSKARGRSRQSSRPCSSAERSSLSGRAFRGAQAAPQPMRDSRRKYSAPAARGFPPRPRPTPPCRALPGGWPVRHEGIHVCPLLIGEAGRVTLGLLLQIGHPAPAC